MALYKSFLRLCNWDKVNKRKLRVYIKTFKGFIPKIKICKEIDDDQQIIEPLLLQFSLLPSIVLTHNNTQL